MFASYRGHRGSSVEDGVEVQRLTLTRQVGKPFSRPREEIVEPELWCVVRVGHSGRCVNYLGCKMSGHLDLLCVREWGNGCGYKISSRPLARITTWKMLKWTVRSCYGRGKFWSMESSRNAEHDVARRGYVCVNCRWPLLLHRSPNPLFIPFEVKSAIVDRVPGSRRLCLQISSLLVEPWSLVL